MTEKIKLAAVGARTSSEDGERDSIEAQIVEARAAAERDGYTVPDWAVTREDGVSGGLPIQERPELMRGLDLLRSARVAVYYWRSLDRLGRRADTYQLVLDHQSHGDGIRLAQMPLTGDPIADAVLGGATGTYGVIERKQIYRRLTAGRNRKTREGGHAVGQLPGWLRYRRHTREDLERAKDDPNYQLTPEGFYVREREAERVRQIIAAYEQGEGGETLAVRFAMSVSGIYRILRDPTVAGRRYVFFYRADSLEAEGRKQARHEREVKRWRAMLEIASAPTPEDADAIADKHAMSALEVPALITWERFAAIQRRLRTPTARGRKPAERLTLQSRVFCGKHGLRCTPARSQSNGGQGNQVYVYAECPARKPSRARARRWEPCDRPRVRWDRLVLMVREKLADMLATPEAIAQSCEDTLASLGARIDQLAAQTGDVSGERDRLQEKIEKWAALYADGDISRERYEHERDRLRREVEKVDRRAASVGSQLAELERLKGRYRTAKALLAVVSDTPYMIDTDAQLERVAVRIDLKITLDVDRLVLDMALPAGDAGSSVDLQRAEANTPAVKARRTGRHTQAGVLQPSLYKTECPQGAAGAACCPEV